jgi:hypothetical protein
VHSLSASARAIGRPKTRGRALYHAPSTLKSLRVRAVLLEDALTFW